MAHKKAGGKTKNGRDSNPKYLGVKLYEGQIAGVGSIIIRQRGTDVLAGRGVAKGKDDTLFAMRAGKVVFSTKRKVGFNSKMKVKKVVSVV
jgi:large subunit ribosomal protein L27